MSLAVEDRPFRNVHSDPVMKKVIEINNGVEKATTIASITGGLVGVLARTLEIAHQTGINDLFQNPVLLNSRSGMFLLAGATAVGALGYTAANIRALVQLNQYQQTNPSA